MLNPWKRIFKNLYTNHQVLSEFLTGNGKRINPKMIKDKKSKKAAVRNNESANDDSKGRNGKDSYLNKLLELPHLPSTPMYHKRASNKIKLDVTLNR